MVDATIIAAPPSTKNKDKARDPEMHQTKKGNPWHFGMKAHIGADDACGVVHSVHTTAANEADVAHTHEVPHGQEQRVSMDAGHVGIQKRPEVIQAQGEGRIAQDVQWSVAAKRGSIKATSEGPLKELKQAQVHVTAQIRSRVEHPFHVIKNLFGHKKVRYKGLAETTGLRHGTPGYSYRRASMGVRLAALLAGRMPKTIPMRPEKPQAPTTAHHGTFGSGKLGMSWPMPRPRP
jgi:transposase, IS5 family